MNKWFNFRKILSIKFILAFLYIILIALAIIAERWDRVFYYIFCVVFAVIFALLIILAAKIKRFFISPVKYVLHFFLSIHGKILLFILAIMPWVFFLGRLMFGRTETSITEIAFAVIISALVFLFFFAVLAFSLHGRKKILAVVMGFICILFIYGGIYNLIFINNPMTFSFAQDIKEGVILQESFLGKLDRLSDLERRLYLATLIRGCPVLGLEVIAAHRLGKEEYVEVTPGLKIKFVFSPNANGPDQYFLHAYHSERETVLGVGKIGINHPEYEYVLDIYQSTSLDAFYSSVDALADYYQKQCTELMNYIENALAQHPEWDILDFCYFSTVTLTTLGYGDIIPNSRLIRMLVMSQAIFGILYIGLALALIRKD